MTWLFFFFNFTSTNESKLVKIQTNSSFYLKYTSVKSLLIAKKAQGFIKSINQVTKDM